MPEYSENGFWLAWDAAATAVSPARTTRALVRVLPPHPSNVVRALLVGDGGASHEMRGVPLGVDPVNGAQVFAVDLPLPRRGETLAWWPVLSCSGRTADPRRGNLPAERVVHAAATAPAEATPRDTTPASADPTLRPSQHWDAVPPSHPSRFAFAPELLFRVTAPVYRDQNPIGETPDGLRMVFALRGGGHVDGPALKGQILPIGGDWMRVRPDGVAICAIHAIIQAEGGGTVLSEYAGVVDFGPDGYRALRDGGGPPRAPLRFAPRYLTAEPRLLWMNRLQCFGIGEVNLEKFLVEYDLYAFRTAEGRHG